MTDKSDEDWMLDALRLADEGLGRVAPNPSVGCVIVKNGEVVGKARTADGGRPHAETMALAEAGDSASGSTVYVTLEPCCHHGNTLPCTDFLIAAKVAKVVIACKDDDRRVSGQGIKALREAGIEVVLGICGEEAKALNEGFFKRIRNYRPLITLKTATSIDSKIAIGPGEKQKITGEAADRRVHYERSRHDAILTGIGTILKDNPLLTTRAGSQDHKSVRIILDTKLRFPPDARMLATKDAGDIWILTAPGSDKAKKAELEKSGLRVVEIDVTGGGRISLPFAMEYLANEGITRLMVEAGQTVFTAFLKLNLWDNLLLFRAPFIMGSGGMDAVGDMEMKAPEMAPRLRLVSHEMLGADHLEIYKKPISLR